MVPDNRGGRNGGGRGIKKNSYNYKTVSWKIIKINFEYQVQKYKKCKGKKGQ